MVRPQLPWLNPTPLAYQMSIRPFGVVSVLAAVLLCTAPRARAEGVDVFTLHATAAVLQDSNLFRLPLDANLPALIGSDSAADQITITTLGLKLNKDYSLQRIELDLNLANYHYQNFNFLNSTANNYSAAWRWSFTPRLRGNLTTVRKETLNDFADAEGFKLRNQRVNVTSRLDGTYDLGGAWRVTAGVAEASQNNPQNQIAEADTVSRYVDAGVSYVAASGSQWGYTLRNAQGSYFPSPNQAGLSGSRYEQTDHEFNVRWILSGKSSADLRLTALSRTQPQSGSRDYNGISAAANYNLKISGKTSLAVGLSRELSSYQTSTSNYAQTDRLSLAPTWAISAKTLLRLSYAVARREYLGAPRVLAANVLHRTDTLSDSSLSFDWQPRPHLTFSAAVQESRRSANVAGLDFQSTITSISAQISF